MVLGTPLIGTFSSAEPAAASTPGQPPGPPAMTGGEVGNGGGPARLEGTPGLELGIAELSFVLFIIQNRGLVGLWVGQNAEDRVKNSFVEVPFEGVGAQKLNWKMRGTDQRSQNPDQLAPQQ